MQLCPYFYIFDIALHVKALESELYQDNQNTFINYLL